MCQFIRKEVFCKRMNDSYGWKREISFKYLSQRFTLKFWCEWNPSKQLCEYFPLWHRPVLLWPTPCAVCVCNTETCGSTVCAWGAQCVQKKCECPQCLDEPLSPVCGSDGVTYGNKCELLLSSCMQKKRIDVAKPGSCDEGRKWTLKWCNYINQSAIAMV